MSPHETKCAFAQTPARSPSRFPLDLPLPAALILLGSAIALAVTGILKPIWVDELLELFSDNQPLRSVLDTQLHHPFSLDPPGFHVIVHGFFSVLPPGILAQRLPSLLFFLLTQYAIFCIVRGLVGTRAALLAMVMPLLTYARHYGSEGRPYALLMAMAATSLLCWYRATDDDQGTPRALSLIGLSVSLAMAILAHYFGVLVAVPLVVAEGFRTFARRRMGLGTDLPVIAAIGAGLAALSIVALCAPATLLYRPHYAPQLPPGRALAFTYARLFAVGHLPYETFYLAILVVEIVVLLWLSLRSLLRLNTFGLTLWIAPALLLLMPLLGIAVLLASKAYDPRYVLPTITGFSILAGVAFAGPSRNRTFFAVSMAAIVTVALAAAIYDVTMAQRDRATFFDVLAPRIDLPATWTDSVGRPNAPVYFRSPEAFLQAHYALPAAAASDSLVLVYSQAFDDKWAEDDVTSRTARNLARSYPGYRIIPWEQFRALDGPRRVRIVSHGGDPDEWLDRALALDGYSVNPVQVSISGVDAVVTAPSRR